MGWKKKNLTRSHRAAMWTMLEPEAQMMRESDRTANAEKQRMSHLRLHTGVGVLRIIKRVTGKTKMHTENSFDWTVMEGMSEMEKNPRKG